MTDQQTENVTPKRKSKMIGWIALVATLLIFAWIAFRIDDWGRDWTQNTAMLDPDSKRVELRPVVLQANAEEVVKQIRNWADANSRWLVVSENANGESPATLKLTRTTPIMRFVDDVEITVEPNSEGGVTVYASSRSRVGKGDLGQNPRNLIELTAFLRDENP